MKIKSKYFIIGAIFLISVLIRVYFSADTEHFQPDGTYYTIHQLENIKETGMPLYNDDLSFSGRTTISPPGYYYLLYIATFALPDDLVFLLLPAILASLSIIIIYFIAKKLTNNNTVAYFSSFISIFIPIYLLRTTNTLSTYTIIMPLMLICLYFFSKIEEKNNTLLWYTVALCALNLISPHSFILIGCLITYVIMIKIEGLKLTKTKKEVIIFSLFFTFWAQFLIYKKALLIHGPQVIWQNIPLELILNYFTEINLLTIIYYVGIIPFFCAIYILYRYSLQVKNKEVDIFIALTILISLFLVFRLIKLEVGLMYLGFCFIIFFSLFYKKILLYIHKTKFGKYSSFILVIFIIFFIFTSIIPSISLLIQNKPIQDETIEALEWIKINTPEKSSVLGTITEGNLITTIAKRKNMIDSNFLLIEDINDRVKDVKTIFTSPLSAKAIELTDFYDIDYIFIDSARKEYSITDLKYSDSECVRLIYDKEIKIYEVLCFWED